MSPRFIGTAEHSLDAKGRLILPARYRGEFDGKGFLSKFNDRCLALWTPEEFNIQLDSMRQLQERSAADRNMVRLWAAGSTEVELDRQGRVAIPGYLREYAGLDDAVLLTGAINRIELWNPAEWHSRVEPSEAELTATAR